MLLSTLVVYDSDFETKGKKIRVKDEIEPQHPQSNVISSTVVMITRKIHCSA